MARSGMRTQVDDAYRTKYARYGDTYLQPMLAEQAAATTLRLNPTERPSTQHVRSKGNHS